MSPPSHFILVVNDAHTSDGGWIPAYEVAVTRLANGAWPIYERTRHRKTIAAGDRVLIYTAGTLKFRQCFMASGTVSSVELAKRPFQVDPRDVITPQSHQVLRLSGVRRFDPPIQIRPLMTTLTFMPSSTKWGAALMGGCRRIEAEDFRSITDRGRARTGHR